MCATIEKENNDKKYNKAIQLTKKQRLNLVKFSGFNEVWFL